MAILSAYMLIRGMALFHLTLAFTMLRDPRLIAEHSLVFVLGESMQLPMPRDFLRPSATTAFIAVLLAFLGTCDLASFSLSEVALEAHWGTQAPVRLLFLFAITGYSYAFKEGGLFVETGQYTKGAGHHLKNSVVFSWGFLELVFWFWIFLSLRDERQKRVADLLQKRKVEADIM
ncbi:hypothetical protein P280DRAFT_389968 [Massarina eburnea CBS 473.64]|uniref:Increased loss of mitochondrial DNA protein 1 n=1 Tax=Massarina eburnea CBS 473.64 TaxID=1395130 RepID=A0A6A6SC75_9PLEO|nr:hypothetical protein P280DRAFT_389968 [Massarina eburnea CBS 473.64]